MKFRKSINAKLWLYFFLYTVAILVVLWLMQIVFLNSYYQNMKKRDVNKVATTIENHINNDDLETVVNDLSYQYDVGVVIVNMQGESVLSEETSKLRIIHRLPPVIMQKLIAQVTNTKDNTLFESIDNNAIRDPMGRQMGPPPNEISPAPAARMLLLGKTLTKTDGSQVVMFLNSSIVPINSTINILKDQMIYIAIVLLLLSILLAFTISHNISKPIIKMNQTAKNLAVGNYNIEFEKGSYDEINQLSETLTTAAKELSRVEELRRELIANVSHDLRTPLTMIKAYAEMLRDLPEDEEKIENLQVIIDETDRLSFLVSDIMKLSQLQAGADTLNIEDYNITKGIEEILSRYKVLNQKSGYFFEFSYGMEQTVKADRIKIDQVIYNLINNAINYAGEDKKIIIRQTVDDGHVKIEVIDHGEGIPKDKLPYIWDRYYKVDKVHKRAVIGTGLGLSIVKKVLDLHNAIYGVDSQIGIGSIFWFQLHI